MSATRRTVAALSLFLLLTVQATHAQTIWQNGTTDNSWQTGGNWSGGTVPTTSDTAQFDDSIPNNPTPLSLGAATTGTLNFINNSNNYTLGSSTDTLTFGGATALNQTGTGTNTINAQILASTALTANVSAGTLNLTNGGNSIASGSSFGVTSGGTLSATGAALGSAGVNLNNGTLVLTGGLGPVPGISGNYWPLSPGDTPANLGHASISNNWGTVNNDAATATSLQNIVNNFGAPIVHQVVADNSTPPSLPNGPSYGAPNNPFAAGTGVAPTGYVGGIDFPNNGNNNFAATGVNISGDGTTGPNYTGPGNGYNGISAEWSGTLHLSQPGTLNFNVDSDDFAAVIVNGVVILNRGNGGTGFSGNASGGQGTGGSVTLPAGSDSIQVIWDQGNGGWGIVGLYSFTPSAGPNMGNAEAANYIGNDNAAGDVTFTTTGVVGVSTAGNPISSTGNSTLTVNSNQASTVGTVTLNNGTNLTVSGRAPLVSFSGTVLNGTSMTISNSVPVSTGAVSGSGGWGPSSTLTAAGSASLYLDNTGNTAFTAGTTINATGSGQVVGVNVTGINTLGSAGLTLNGGNFSLGTDGVNNAFGNAITVSGSGGTITGQALGAGATANQTVNLTGGIMLNGGTLNLNTNNGYTIEIGSQITGGASINGNGNVAINTASGGFTGTYNVNGGTTSENVIGGFGTAFVNINNGASLNMTAAGDTLGRGANVNSGNLNLNAGGINLANTNINGGGTLNLNSDQGASGGTVPNSAIQGTVSVNTFQSAGYNLTMAGNSSIQSNGTQSFASNLALQGNVNVGANNSNLSLTGNLSGAGGLSQNGAGTLTLSGPTGSASYGGATNVNAGTLALQTNLTGGGPVNVNPTTTLNVGSNGSVGGSALTVYNALVTVTGNTNLGSGSAQVSNGGTVRFDSANTSFSGTTMNFNNGTINAHSGAANLGATNLVAVPFSNAPSVPNALATNEYPFTNSSFGTTSQTPDQGTNNANTATAANHYITGDLSAPISSPLLSAAHEGPAPGGINFPNSGPGDANFQAFFGTPTVPDFGSTFYGIFTAPTAGTFHFSANLNDDQESVVVQPLANASGNHFNTSGAGLQTSSAGCCNNQAGFDTTATAGEQFLVAYTMRDTGGGSGLVGYITLPGGSAMVVDPGSAAQAGLWSTVPAPNGGATANIDANASLAVNSFTGFTNVNLTNGSSLTLSNQTMSTATSSDTTNMSVTGTSATAALNLGTFTTVHVQNLSVADGNTLNVSGVGGVLKVEGAGGPGTGTVAVAGGASYGGHGSFAGTLSIGSGGILAPGDAANTTVGGLTLGDNSTMNYNLNTRNVEHAVYNPANGNDLTTVTNSGGLSFSNTPYVFGVDGTTVNVIAGANFGRGTYELLAYTGSSTGNLSSFGIGTAPSGFQYQFVNLVNPGGGGGQIDLLVTPEPSAVVLMVLGLAGLGFGCRRRLARRAA